MCHNVRQRKNKRKKRRKERKMRMAERNVAEVYVNVLGKQGEEKGKKKRVKNLGEAGTLNAQGKERINRGWKKKSLQSWKEESKAKMC